MAGLSLNPGVGVDSVCGAIVESEGEIGEYCLTLRDGRVEGYNEAPRGSIVLDLRGTRLKIIPGLVDLHVHLRGLHLSYKEDELTGTMGAARSGITLVADMPNTLPRLDSPESLSLKLEALASNSIVDYTVYAAIPETPDSVEKLARQPVAGFKVYPADYRWEDSIRRAASSGKLVVVHPELPEAENPAVEDPASRAVHRGCHLEAAAVPYLAPILDGGRVHVTHASCPSTVSEAKRHGYTVDVAPHHILYSAEPGGDPCTSRVNPPLRSRVDAELLALKVLEGTVDALASDHAPHAWWEKSEPLACKPGFPWLGLWPWAARKALRLTLSELVKLASRRPAEILGLYPAYGSLQPGARANVVVVDPDQHWRHTGFPHSKHRLPTHFMLEAWGEPVHTIVGGMLVYTASGELAGTGHKPGVNALEWTRKSKIPPP